MNKVFKKALGFAGALGLTAVMVLAAAPVQASDVDARIRTLERQLAQVQEEQESALAAEMKGPAFRYAAGKGLTIAAADNNWSITFGQRLQIYTSMWLTNDDPAKGYRNGTIRIRRFRPNINVSSQQGFYEVKWTFSGNTTVAFDGDAYLHFEKLNPWLPTMGYGYNPSFSSNSGNGAGRTEDSLFINGLGLGGGQDGSVVLSWKTLPAMGISRISHLELAVGLDNQDEYGSNTPTGGVTAGAVTGETVAAHTHKDTPKPGTDGRSVAFALGLQPLAKAKGMGGFDVSSVAYNFGYESLNDLPAGFAKGMFSPTTQNAIKLLSPGNVLGDHTYTYHGFAWSPLKWLGLNAHLASYEADAAAGAEKDIEGTEFRLAATVWLWGPKSGMMGGSKSEGGIYVSPLFTRAEFEKPFSADATNNGLAVVYNVPGGWMQIHGVWDQLGCESTATPNPCGTAGTLATADAGDDSTSVFTLMVEYRF